MESNPESNRESKPHIPSSDDADTDVQSTPGGLADELEQEANERDAEQLRLEEAARASLDTGADSGGLVGDGVRRRVRV